MGQYIIRQLIAPVDSPTGKRYGLRDRIGYFIEACGFDLSPLAERLEEYIAVADRAEKVHKEHTKLRRLITMSK